jgi:hypothetical protein
LGYGSNIKEGKLSLKDKIIKKGEKVFTKVVDKTLAKTPKDKQAALLAENLRRMIRFTGVVEMRRRVIEGIEGDFRKKLADNPDISIDELIAEYVNEPEAMLLFKDLEMGDEHLRAMAKNAIAEMAKGEEK